MAPAPDIPHVWYYYVSEQECLPYPDAASADLENAYLQWQQDPREPVEPLRSGKYTYAIDFQRMLQRNTATGRTRRLERRQSHLGMELFNALTTKEEDMEHLQEQLEQEHRERDRLLQQVEEHDLARESELQKSQQLSRRLTATEQQVQQCRASQQQAEALLQKHVEKIKTLEGQLADAGAQTAQTEQWEVQNHVGAWQPYDAVLNESMVSLHKQWLTEQKPNTLYDLNGRWHVSFAEMKQLNVAYNTRRDIRQRTFVSQTSAATAQLQGQLSELKDDKLALERQLKVSQSDLTREREALAQALGVQEELKRSKAEISAEVSRLKEDLRTSRVTASSLQGDTEQRCHEIHQLQQAIANMKLALEAAQAEAQEMKRQHRLAADAAATQQFELDRLQRALQESQQLRVIADLERAEQQRKTTDLETAIDEERKQVREEHAEQQRKISALQRSIEDEREERAAQQRKTLDVEHVIAEERKHACEERAEQQRKISTLQKSIDEACEKRAEQQREFSALQKTLEEERAEQQRKISALAKSKAKDAVEKAVDKEKDKQQERLKVMATSVFLHPVTSSVQQNMLSKVPLRDEDTLRKTGTSELLDETAKEFMDRSKSFRLHMQGSFSPSMLSLLSDLPDAKDYVPEAQETNIKRGSADFLVLEHLFKTSVTQHRRDYHSEEWCEPPKLQIVEILQVQFPPKLLTTYNNECRRISKRDLPCIPIDTSGALKPVISTPDVNERFLFHGTPWKSAGSISQSGFDWKHRGENTGVMFGQGIYFAPHSSKCDQYADKNEEGLKCMFLARVILGASLPRWRRCTDVKNLAKDYDSIRAVTRQDGGSVDHPEFCIFQKAQALPCFKFIYKHEQECACHLCRREREPSQ